MTTVLDLDRLYGFRTNFPFLPRDAMHKRGLCCHAVYVFLEWCSYPTVVKYFEDMFIRFHMIHERDRRTDVQFVDHVKTNKHIFEIFLPSGSYTILVFPYQTGWRYSDGNPPNGGVECRCGRQKTRFWTNIWLRYIHWSTVLSTVRVANCEKQSRDGRRRASSTHRSVRRPLFAQDDDEVFVMGSTLYAEEEVKLPRTQHP